MVILLGIAAFAALDCLIFSCILIPQEA